MKAYSEYFFSLLLVALLAAVYAFMGPRVAIFAGLISVTWFGISFVLMTRPPGLPELVSEEGTDEQKIARKDVFETLPVMDRLRVALGVACGACLLVWLTLFLLRG